MSASTAPLKVVAVACVLLLLSLGVYLAPLQPGVVALQLTWTPESFAAVLQAWGPEGIPRFRRHLPVDGLLLLSYGAMGYLAVARTRFFEPLSTRFATRHVAWLLPLAAVCDAAENLLHWYLTSEAVLSHTVGVSAAWYAVAGCCAAGKWLGISAFASAAVLRRV